jgi:hypothetical protein
MRCDRYDRRLKWIMTQILYEIDGCTFYLQTSKEYQQEYDMRRGSEYSRFHGYTYDGVWTAALAIQEVARKVHQSSHDKGILNRTIADFQYRNEEWENLFLEALTKTSFEGVTVINYNIHNIVCAYCFIWLILNVWFISGSGEILQQRKKSQHIIETISR